MGCKAAETTRNINNAFGPGTADERTVQWFKKFCKGDESLEDEEHSGRPSEIDNQLRASSKLILLEREKSPNDSILTILPSFGIWSKLERWKSSISGYLWADHKSKKSLSWSIIFSHSAQQWNISWWDYEVWWEVDCIQQLATASSVAGPRWHSKALPKAEVAPKKGQGHCLVVRCQSDPLQHSEPQWNHYIWDICSKN